MVVHVEQAVHYAQTLHAVHAVGHNAETLEVVENIRLNAVQPGLCGFERIRFDAKGQILGLDKPIIALGELIAEHTGVLAAYAVVLIAAQGNGNALAVAVLVGGHIDE